MSLKAALAYARIGWAVFPVGEDCRSPLVGPPPGGQKGEGGCWRATTDPAVLTDWWTRWPSANMSLACGEKSGAWALDVDHHGAVDGFESLAILEDQFGQLPDTPKAKTPGGGEHLIFKHIQNLPNRVGIWVELGGGERRKLGGLDVRSTGGSIALAPSRKPSGPYSWIVSPTVLEPPEPPAWLLELIDPPPPPHRPLAPLRISSADRAGRYVASAVNGECTAVAETPANSGRNPRLFVAACNLGALVGAGILSESLAEDALTRAADACGLTRDDGQHQVRQTIASGMRRGLANPREVNF